MPSWRVAPKEIHPLRAGIAEEQAAAGDDDLPSLDDCPCTRARRDNMLHLNVAVELQVSMCVLLTS